MDVPLFTALSLTALVVAGAMAYGLSIGVRQSPDFFGLVVLLAIPVLGTIGAAVYIGRCRNMTFAVSLAALAMSLYYVGAWAIAYKLDMSMAGPRLAAMIRTQTGLPAPLGYFVIRCDLTFGSFVHPGWTAARALQHAGELALGIGVGVFLVRRLAGRVYFESHRRWAASWALGFEPRDRPKIEAALATRDWPALDNVEKTTVTRDLRRRGINVFRVEYLPGAGDQAAYVTVEAARFARMGSAALTYIPLLHRFTKAIVRQQLIPPDEVSALARHLPGFGLAAAGAAPRERPASGQLEYWSDATTAQPAGARPAVQNSGFVSVLREVGFVGTTLVGRGQDFRAAGSQASLALTFGTLAVDVDSVDASLCLPTAPSPPVGTLKGFAWIELGVMYTFLGCQVIGAVSVGLVPVVFGAGHPFVAFAAVALGGLMMAVGGLLALFLLVGYRPLMIALLTRYFRRRGSSILPPNPSLKRNLLRIEDAATFHINKATPEDFGVGVLDPYRARVLIEGVTHRYALRGADVLEIAPIKGNSASARVVYRTGDATVAMVVNLYRPWIFWLGVFASLPLIGLPLRPLAHKVPLRWARRLESVLRPPVTATAPLHPA